MITEKKKQRFLLIYHYLFLLSFNLYLYITLTVYPFFQIIVLSHYSVSIRIILVLRFKSSNRLSTKYLINRHSKKKKKIIQTRVRRGERGKLSLPILPSYPTQTSHAFSHVTCYFGRDLCRIAHMLLCTIKTVTYALLSTARQFNTKISLK